MRFKKATIRYFKRFANLTVQGIPETARLIMLAGPNGSGKSSFFDALRTWHGLNSGKNPSWQEDYHLKAGSTNSNWDNNVSLEFHDSQSGQNKKTLYIRSAYRNDPDFRISSLQQQGDPLDLVLVGRMIDNDASVGRNYQRLVSQGLDDLYGRQSGETTFDEYRERSIGTIRDPLNRILPELQLDDLGNPLEDGTFRFTKGDSRGFLYKNLSGGEKATFDLILDITIARRYYDDTIYCIDEPESHMNARLQAELLSVLYELIPEDCQLMLATHSIGMMRRARDIEDTIPGSVVFLDFGDRDFDKPQIIEPATPNRKFWKNAYDVALGDLSELVAPGRVVMCEGEQITDPPRRNQSLDADCYMRIFEDEFPETEFMSIGNDQQILDDQQGFAVALRNLIGAMAIVRLIDRDDRSPEEVEQLAQQGVRVLARRNLESYLFDDEVLQTLAEREGQEDKTQELLAEKQEILTGRINRLPDDLKPARGEIYEACQKVLGITQRGNNAGEFMRYTLAPLVRPGMSVYEELKRDIFGDGVAS